MVARFELPKLNKKTIAFVVAILLLLAGAGFLYSEYLKSKQDGQTGENPPDGTEETGETGGSEETPEEGALVTKATASVSPASASSTTCSKKFTFTGKITTSKETTVSYHWEKSNGSKSSTKTLEFAAAATKSVSYSWTVSGDYSGWAKLVVTSPEALSSGKASFTFTCQFAVTAVTASVSPSTNNSCPETYTFTGRITANEAGTVRYKWERYFDGASQDSSALKTVTFTGAGTKTVTESQMYNDAGLMSYLPPWLAWLRSPISVVRAIVLPTYEGWERVKITSPNAKTSNQADFIYDPFLVPECAV